MKNILIICDSFKETFKSTEISSKIKNSLLKTYSRLNIDIIPYADGGEGTIEAINYVIQKDIIKKNVMNPIHQKVNAEYLFDKKNKTAIIEMAKASGLHLVSENDRNPLYTTTFGTGQLIESALNKNVDKIILGLGGSATVDAGAGILSALGIVFINSENIEFIPTGGTLTEIKDIKFSDKYHKYKTKKYLILSDVDSPLLGSNGAAAVYGPQKGASENDVSCLEQNLSYFAEFIKKRVDFDISSIPATGAAGGIAAGMAAFFDVDIVSGAEFILDYIDFNNIVKKYDIIITGEGRFDYQSLYGKGPVEIAKRCKKMDKKIVMICGSIGDKIDDKYKKYFDFLFDITATPGTLEENIIKTEQMLDIIAYNIKSCF